jgi:hypothetical protein
MTQVEPSGTMLVFTATSAEVSDDDAAETAALETQSDYYRERERRERAAAKKASSHAARSVHQALAQRYAALSRGTRNGP